MNVDFRKMFYSVACLATLSLSGWGAYTMLSAGMRAVFFTEADRTYIVETYRLANQVDVNKAEQEEADRKNAVAHRQADLAWALSVLVVNLPIFIWAYRKMEYNNSSV